ncbi:protein Loquacious-like [Arctopsyche grandis]|uniref:protein Loquacious-like n=1 Tax=Arctopsyche grandis TaxID=121162 RepID=UPI00406D9DAC
MNTKTPIMILQELMMKKGCTPSYEFLDGTTACGHFRCSVRADSYSEIGTGRTKKDAKQNAAILILEKLTELGMYFPPPNVNTNIKGKTQENEVSSSNVANLLDLCVEYYLPTPVFELLSETGPPHSKMFTMECKTGSVVRQASGTTKKIAKQKVAGLILDYFQENVPQRIADIEQINTNALVQLKEIAKLRYSDFNKDTPWRPNLGQVIANYHFGFINSIEKSKLEEFISLLQNCDESTASPIIITEELFQKIPLEFEWSELLAIDEKHAICAFSATHANPPIFIASSGENAFDAKKKCSISVLEYVNVMVSLL